ncbi:MAG: rane protein [Burkholderiaceae bacterium]|nr:rane protein [Burkholderiaceae bacterium]
MATPNRTDAQQHADDILVFRRELARLEQDGVLALTELQRQALAAHHDALLAQYAQTFDIDRDTRGKQLSLGMRIASSFGALALAASVFFLFYQFWGLFGTTAQVALLLLAALGSFIATLWVQAKDASGYFTKLAAMIAFACFVLNLTMLGQIFNLTPSDTIFIVLAAHALLLAYVCNSRQMLAAGLLCVIAFLSARTGIFCGLYWLNFGERPENFFPAAMLLFAIPLFIRHERFARFDATYRTFALLALFLPMLVLANWGQVSYLLLDRSLIQGLYQILGFVLSAGAIWLGARRGWNEVINSGFTFFAIFLYTKFFDWWWRIMPKYLFFLVIGLSALLLLLVLKRLRTAAVNLFGKDQP